MRIPAEPAAARPEDTVQPSAKGRDAIRQQVRGFLIVGAVCTIASVAIFALIRPILGVQWANLISLVLTSILNTDLNRRHSFGIHERARWIGDQRRGLWVMLLALGLTSGSLWLLHTVAPGASFLDELLVITAANVLAAVTRFLLLRYWIFRRIRNS
ncbi:GtrA family protein [Arthrobacter sp. H14-L1]|uniref:GtrA family protein n=1 Tax=Arthrobacter sp. H14-L1 TaxID=2996697 RepID=UPI00226DD669|nr:GtrA family protein [Arthrobacter sp. H14-L1]